MEKREDIIKLVFAARAEPSSLMCKKLLKDAIRMCNDWIKEEGGTEAIILKANALADLAVEENTPQKRTAHWNNALKSLKKNSKETHVPELVETYSSLAVDCFQDTYSTLKQDDRQRILQEAKRYLDNVIAQNPGRRALATLLARKSSVLRHLTFFDLGKKVRNHHLQESKRCAERAVDESREAGTLLELGIAEWSLARYESTDEQYVSRIRQAEKHLSDKALKNFEPAILTRARFYRLTSRPLDSCEIFTGMMNRVKHMRRLLRDSYIFGEAAIQLWHSDYPDTITNPHLSEACNLMEAALAAGYTNARTIVDLSFVRAIREGPQAGSTALSDLCAEGVEIDWQKGLRLAADSGTSDLVSQGFALGIDDGAVWTRLGTFSWLFLKDEKLAELLYRGAVRLSPNDPIALTNLARFLVKSAPNNSLQEAQRLIQKASSFADRRFRWWRSVLAEIQVKKAISKERKTKPPHQEGYTLPPIKHFDRLPQIRRRFQHAERMANSQQRGYELEILFYELANLTCDMAAPPYRIKRIEGGISQIDGYFQHKGEKYRVECKWLAKCATHNHIIEFSDKVEAAGISGLFISMSGFTKAAVGRARALRKEKAILLMDGNEVRMIFEGSLNFDELVTRKRLHFDQRSDPYYRIVYETEMS